MPEAERTWEILKEWRQGDSPVRKTGGSAPFQAPVQGFSLSVQGTLWVPLWKAWTHCSCLWPCQKRRGLNVGPRPVSSLPPDQPRWQSSSLISSGDSASPRRASHMLCSSLHRLNSGHSTYLADENYHLFRTAVQTFTTWISGHPLEDVTAGNLKASNWAASQHGSLNSWLWETWQSVLP